MSRQAGSQPAGFIRSILARRVPPRGERAQWLHARHVGPQELAPTIPWGIRRAGDCTFMNFPGLDDQCHRSHRSACGLSNPERQGDEIELFALQRTKIT
jgi:hypothetical protein